MNIALRLEGGLGDHLLANRFSAAIREKYPESHITMYSDTEGNPTSSELLFKLFPKFYNSYEVIQNRKSKEFKIQTKFGNENYPAHIDNIPEDYSNKFLAADKFYDLHIDGLKWLNADFDWLRYYYFFPKPQIEFQKYKDLNFKYILCHLYARPDSPYNLEKWYCIDLIKKISKFSNVVIITQSQHVNFYEEIFNSENIFITTPNLEQCFSLASECEAFIGIDSGIRYIPYHFSKPVFVFSKYCHQYGSVAPSHLIRWLIFQKNVFPMHLDMSAVEKILKNCLDNSYSSLFPELSGSIDDFIVNRKL
jgi:ADP-heptose:LPS heptosyltransferase